jgi:hypothetical protein
MHNKYKQYNGPKKHLQIKTITFLIQNYITKLNTFYLQRFLC